MNTTDSEMLGRFERLEIDAPGFRHADHVRVACEMLGKYEFFDACSRYAKTILAMATGVGVPEKFNATITFAFMSLIAERRASSDATDVDTFLAENPDLLDKDLLDRWYSKERLASPLARTQFLLPNLP